MRFLIVENYYEDFQTSVYAERPELMRASYDAHLAALIAQNFGSSDYFSTNLKALGHEASDVIMKCEPLQREWELEHNITVEPVRFRLLPALRRGYIPAVRRQRSAAWIHQVLGAQIEAVKPDVLYVHDLLHTSLDFLRKMKKHVGIIVGQHAVAPLPSKGDWSAYDLILSSFLPTVDLFRARGVPSELLRLGFEPRVLTAISPKPRCVPVSFVGSFHTMHAPRTRLLARLAQYVPLSVWGPPLPSALAATSLAASYRGEAWGLGMFDVLSQSKKITINPSR